MVGEELRRLERLEMERPPGPSLSAQVRRGLMVTVALTILTIIEYVIAVEVEDPLIWLLPFVVAKGWLILEYFMHFSAMLGRGEH